MLAHSRHRTRPTAVRTGALSESAAVGLGAVFALAAGGTAVALYRAGKTSAAAVAAIAVFAAPTLAAKVA